MSNSLFPNFAKELQQHAASEYHVAGAAHSRESASEWFIRHGICCPLPYLEFLVQFGPGRFFGGDLIIFAFDGGRWSIEAASSLLPRPDDTRYFAIGYDGTTEGLFCLDRTGHTNAVYWHNFQAGTTVLLAHDFVKWIEAQPSQLFDSKIYKGYQTIRDIAGVRHIMRERAAFAVRLISADTSRVRPPNRQSDFLPRYHRIVVGIQKLRGSHLNTLTIALLRKGSTIADGNVEYFTMELPDFEPGTEITKETFVFDPYNLPFQEFELLHVPEIDLSSPMRTKFKEIGVFL